MLEKIKYESSLVKKWFAQKVVVRKLQKIQTCMKWVQDGDDGLRFGLYG